MSFKNFIAKLKLRYFSYTELLVSTKEPENTEPPPEMWNNIVPTILILDRLRDCLGVSVHLTSVYRAPAYNATIENAAKFSLHQAFAAVDIQIPNLADKGVSLKTVYELLKLWQDRWFESPVPIGTKQVTIEAGEIPHEDLDVRENNGVHEFQFKGFIGYYGTYIHIDTRGINNKKD